MRSEQEITRAIARHADTVRRICLLHLKNASDTEDVFQEVFLKYALSTVAFDSEEHEKAWLIRVTINICRNRLRSPWRRHKELNEAVSETAFVEQWDSVLEDESGVMTAVMQLPHKYQEVIHLFYFEDCSIAQIASILRKKESTVRSLLYRARAMLKDALKEGWNFE